MSDREVIEVILDILENADLSTDEGAIDALTTAFLAGFRGGLEKAIVMQIFQSFDVLKVRGNA